MPKKQQLISAFVRIVTLFVVLLAFVSCRIEANPRQSPNIIMVVIDDVGWADLSLGRADAVIQTPFIDRLSSQGIRLTNHYVSLLYYSCNLFTSFI